MVMMMVVTVLLLLLMVVVMVTMMREVKVKSLSRVQLFATPWTYCFVCQALKCLPWLRSFSITWRVRHLKGL